MRQDLTEVIMVVDRSGSMQSCRQDAEGGINAFIDEQKKAVGRCNFTLVQFDTQYEFVYKGIDIQDVPNFTLLPRGATALYDAIGQAINETGKRLADMHEADRPALVAFVVQTDGLENSSKEFSRETIKQMIEHQRDKYNWKFTFLGANQNAVLTGTSLGFDQEACATYSEECTSGGILASANMVSRARAATMNCCDDVDFRYTEQERKSMTEGS